MNIEKILDDHQKWLTDGSDKRADLRDADLRDADLRDADLRGADLRGADLRGADLRGANLWDAQLDNCVGNGKEIKSLQIENYCVVYTRWRLFVGCRSCTIKDIDKGFINMDEKELALWDDDKDFIKNILKSYPAV